MIFMTYSVIYIGMSFIKEGTLDDINYMYFGLFAVSAGLTLFSYPMIYIFDLVIHREFNGLVEN